MVRAPHLPALLVGCLDKLILTEPRGWKTRREAGREVRRGRLTYQIHGHIDVPHDPVKPLRQNHIVHFRHLPAAMRGVRALITHEKVSEMHHSPKGTRDGFC